VHKGSAAFVWVVALAGMAWAQPVCSTLSELSGHEGQRVVVVGRYQAVPNKPSTGPTGIDGFQPGPRPYGRAVIVVEGGELSVDPPLSKTSLRNPDELEDYSGSWVRATGVVRGGKQAHVQIESLDLDLRESKEFEPHSLVSELAGLESWKFVKQEEIPGARPWDLSRDYAARVGGVGYTLTLFRYPAGTPKEPPPARPDGMQVAYSTGGTPAHVGMVRLAYSGLPANWGSTVSALAQLAFGAQGEQLKWLSELRPDTKMEGEKDGLQVQVRPGCVTLWGGSPLEARRDYLLLEPRGRRKP
jgi:hypothetical protein